MRPSLVATMAQKMFAMQLPALHAQLVPVELPMPTPTAKGDVLVEIDCCAICRTDLHVVDGELPDPVLPIIPGHQIVGRVKQIGPDGHLLKVGDRVGIPWLGKTCGHCEFCTTLGQENLCDSPTFTGFQRNGGFATHTLVSEQFAFPLPEDAEAKQLAPLLCGGLIGYRTLRKAGDAKRVGVYGFGSAASMLIQVMRYQGREVYAFPRAGDQATMEFAKKLGAVWAGGSDGLPPVKLDAALIFAPVGSLVTQALKAVRKGGKVVCGGISMSDIPSFPYRHLWEEREIISVANLTRQDGVEFLELAPKVPVKTVVTTYPLKDANRALDDLRHGRFHGSAVLIPPGKEGIM